MIYFICFYTILHILTFLFVRYYCLREVFATRHDPHLLRKYPLFQRIDLDRLCLIKSFPFYMTYWPRFIFAQASIFSAAILSVILTIGVKDISGVRYNLVKAIF